MSKTAGAKCRGCGLYRHPKCEACGQKMVHALDQADRRGYKRLIGWGCPRGHGIVRREVFTTAPTLAETGLVA